LMLSSKLAPLGTRWLFEPEIREAGLQMALFCASVLTYWFSAPPLSPKGLAGTPRSLENHHFRLGLTNF
jgi:hypothetical protein